MDPLKMYFLWKMGIFHCHVGLLEGRERLWDRIKIWIQNDIWVFAGTCCCRLRLRVVFNGKFEPRRFVAIFCGEEMLGQSGSFQLNYILFMFTPKVWGNDPMLTSISFSTGLVQPPPTSWWITCIFFRIWSSTAWMCCSLVSFLWFFCQGKSPWKTHHQSKTVMFLDVLKTFGRLVDYCWLVAKKKHAEKRGVILIIAFYPCRCAPIFQGKGNGC